MLQLRGVVSACMCTCCTCVEAFNASCSDRTTDAIAAGRADEDFSAVFAVTSTCTKGADGAEAGSD